MVYRLAVVGDLNLVPVASEHQELISTTLISQILMCRSIGVPPVKKQEEKSLIAILSQRCL